MFSNDFTPKKPKDFSCKNCNFKSSNKKDYTRHINTIKHKNNICQQESIIFTPFTQNYPKYSCFNCGKKYKDNSGLWRHKKKCTKEHDVSEEDEQEEPMTIDKDFIINSLIKLLQNGTNNTTTNTNTNTNSHNNIDNKTFNLNFFLNETCKDAMNISDFVSSVQVSLDDLENTGRQGYVEGITNIVLKNLNKMEQSMRPLHCSDLKREVFYIKDNNEWQKENTEKPILTKAIKVIANENIKQIKNWRDKYSGCTDAESKKNDLYLKIVSNSMNGSTQEVLIKL